MKRKLLKQILIVLVLFSGLLAGDLRVTIFNGTKNAPGYADRVVLMDISKGMVELATISDVKDAVTFSDVYSSGQNQYLIKASLNGVNYSTTFVPSSTVTAWETSITVYETREQISDLHVSVPFFVIYAFEERLYIQKRLVLENHSNPPVSFIGSPGLISIHIPENVTQLDNLTFKNSSMPIRTQPINTDKGQVIANALKPGSSEVDLAYYLPYESSQAVLTEKVSYDIDPFHVYVMPISMQISAPGLSRKGTDNENGYAIYAISNVKAETEITFHISGQGMSETALQQQQQQNRGRVVVEHRLDMSTKLVFAGVLILLILIALFISISSQNDDLKQVSMEMLNEQKDTLLQEYAALDKSSGDDSGKEKILHQLISVYKTQDRIK